MRHNIKMITDHLTIIPLSETGSEQFRLLRNREEIRKWFIYKGIISIEDQKKWYASYLENDADYMFEIREGSETGQFLGAASIYQIDKVHQSAELGRIIIDHELAGKKGYGTETVKSLSEISFQVLNLDLIYANIYEDNLASIYTFQRAGFDMKQNTFDKDGKKLYYLEKRR